MDLKQELNQAQEQLQREIIPKVSQEKILIRSKIDLIDKRLSHIQTLITDQERKISSVQAQKNAFDDLNQQLSEKKALLKLNESTILLHRQIENNRTYLTEALDTLQKNKNTAENEISQFLKQNTQADIHQQGYLKTELETKKNKLIQIIEKIENFQEVTTLHQNIMTRFFYFLRTIIGNTPIQIKEKEYDQLKSEIDDIEKIILNYSAYSVELRELHKHEPNSNAEALQIANNTHAQLNQQIRSIQTQMKNLAKSVQKNEKKFKKEERLYNSHLDENKELNRQQLALREQLKNSDDLLKNFQNPARVTLIAQLSKNLILAEEHRTQKIKQKETYSQQRFFQHINKGGLDVQNSIIITKYIDSIRTFMNQLDHQSAEYNTLRDITTTIIKLHMLTPTTLADKNTETLLKQQFIDQLHKLPQDNSLRATQNYILSVLTQTIHPQVDSEHDSTLIPKQKKK